MPTDDLHAIDRGRGPAVLLVHGFPLGSWMWEPQLEPLAARYRVIAPDLRGFGASPLGEARAVEDHADDLAALLRAREIARAAVVGFSMGGYVALAFAERHPSLLAALVLADTRASPDAPEGKAGRDAMAARARAEGAVPIAATMAEKLFAKATKERDPALVERVRARMAENPAEGIARACEAMRDRPDRRPLLASIRVPALAIVGSDDALTPPAEARAMVEVIPGARLAVIEGAGHASNLERPDEFNRALLDFLDGAFPLAEKRCVPCRGGVPPLDAAAVEGYLAKLDPAWRAVDAKKIERTFKLKNFREALAFTNRVGELAEAEGHHPDIHLAWGKVKVEIWTHKVGGLTESDFVLAAKIDRLAAG